MNGPLVVGIGNVLLGDDGFGPAVCEELRRRGSQLRLLDGGTLGTALVPWLVDAPAVVMVDAVDESGTPGSLVVRRAASLARLAADGGNGLADLVAHVRLGGLSTEALALVGVIPAEIRPHVGLSAEVSNAVPRAASLVEQEIHQLMGGMG